MPPSALVPIARSRSCVASAGAFAWPSHTETCGAKPAFLNRSRKLPTPPCPAAISESPSRTSGAASEPRLKRLAISSMSASNNAMNVSSGWHRESAPTDQGAPSADDKPFEALLIAPSRGSRRVSVSMERQCGISVAGKCVIVTRRVLNGLSTGAHQSGQQRGRHEFTVSLGFSRPLIADADARCCRKGPPIGMEEGPLLIIGSGSSPESIGGTRA